jgi:protein-tyrosine phosphatase
MPGPGALVDLHSHLVPGVDDGAESLDDTLEGVQRMAEVGITRIVTTPHLDGALTHDPEALEARLSEVDAAWAVAHDAVTQEFPEVEFDRGHEVMVNVPDLVLSDARLRLAAGACVLIEWPRLQLPPRTEYVVEKIVDDGFVPVIAHPERYSGMADQFHLAQAWKRAGAVLQVNHGSFLGRYGKDAEIVATALAQNGLVDCLSTDFHGRGHLKLFVKEARRWFEERDGAEQFYMLTSTNPRRILDGETPLPVTPLRVQRGLWERMRGIVRNG